MKKIFLLLFLSVFLFGCAPQDPPALKIGSVEVSAQEFDQAFQHSRYFHLGQSGREAFLDHYIDVKLILLEAERAGLDKDPAFLIDIQHFWEQALLKRILEQENKLLAYQVDVSPEEVASYYQKHKDGDFAGKTLEEVSDQIRWLIVKIKQSEALSGWTKGLREKINIRMNKDLLGIQQQEEL